MVDYDTVGGAPACPVRCVEIAQAYKEGFFMDKVKSKPGLLNFFHKSPAEIQKYFEHLPNLIEQFPLDVVLTYVFARVELAHNMALYCGIAKLHRADTGPAMQSRRTT